MHGLRSQLTISTDLSPFSGMLDSSVTVSDKLEHVKHDLATETRARISRDDEASHRLPKDI